MSDLPSAFKVKANEFVFEFDRAAIEAVDMVRKSPENFNLIKDHRSANARVLEADSTGKHLKIEVDGETFEIAIKDPLDQMLDTMGFSVVSTRHIKEIKAPMPGMVLSVAVQEGQEVLEGERLLILEAMKMENSLLLHTNATIKRITVVAGQAVEKGQVLIELE